MKKAAFFDRDGTLIKDVPYLADLAKVELLPNSLELCRKLQQKGYMLFVVTNQAGVARGFFDEAFVKKTHKYLDNLFMQHNIAFTYFYYCPHHPLQNCLCRKPSPGMLFQAAREYNLELSQSLLFGDKDTDVQAGERAGCKSFYIQDFLKNDLVVQVFDTL